ncbi:MAG: hypothetical protein ACFNPX_07755 [Neisseria subflava]
MPTNPGPSENDGGRLKAQLRRSQNHFSDGLLTGVRYSTPIS